MKYNDAVREARTLVKRSEIDQWRLAQLTWEQVEAGTSRRQWAKDIEVSYSHTDRLYQIWTKWRDTSRVTRPTYTEAYNQIMGGSPIERGREQGARQAFAELPEKQQQQIVRNVVKTNPDIMRDVIAHDSKAAEVARSAVLTRAINERPGRDGDVRTDPTIKRMIEDVKRNDAALAFYAARKAAREVMDFRLRDVADEVARDQSSPDGIAACADDADQISKHFGKLADALHSMVHGGALEVVK